MIVFPRKQGLLDRERESKLVKQQEDEELGKRWLVVASTLFSNHQNVNELGSDRAIEEEEEAEELDVLMAQHL
jgi:hypothetical protein